MRWNVVPGEAIPFTVDRGIGDDLPFSGMAIEAAIKQAFAAWEKTQCSLCHDPDGVACPPVHCGGHGLGLSFRYDGLADRASWGPECVNQAGAVTAVSLDGCPFAGGPWTTRPNGNQIMAFAGQRKWPFSSFTVALTLVAANEVTGQIRDADIMINAQNQQFCTAACKPTQTDLQSALTHEAGHFLGLDHVSNSTSTMFLHNVTGATFMRTPEPADSACLCRAYRMAYDPAGCTPAASTSCAAMPSPPTSGGAIAVAWLFLAAIAAGFTRRRA